MMLTALYLDIAVSGNTARGGFTNIEMLELVSQ